MTTAISIDSMTRRSVRGVHGCMVPATYRLSDGMSEQVHARFGQRPTGEVLLLLVDSGMDTITVDSPRRFGTCSINPDWIRRYIMRMITPRG